MKLSYREVCNKWLDGKRGIAKGGSLATDGKRIYSYMLPIAERVDTTTIGVLVDRFYSRTTSGHLNCALAAAQSRGFKVSGPEGVDDGK